jgi:hypothetical protein
MTTQSAYFEYAIARRRKKKLTFEHLIYWLKVHFTLAIKLRVLLQLWCTNSERLKEFRFIL